MMTYCQDYILTEKCGVHGLKHRIVKITGGRRCCRCGTSNNKRGTRVQLRLWWKTEFQNCTNLKDDIWTALWFYLYRQLRGSRRERYLSRMRARFSLTPAAARAKPNRCTINYSNPDCWSDHGEKTAPRARDQSLPHQVRRMMRELRRTMRAKTGREGPTRNKSQILWMSKTNRRKNKQKMKP